MSAEPSGAGASAPAAATAISDEALLAEAQRRGLLPPATGERVVSPASSPAARVRSPPSRVRSPDSRVSGADGPCLVELGPPGGPLAPRLTNESGGPQLFSIQETGGLRGSVAYSWELVEDAPEDTAAQAPAQHGQSHHKRLARVSGNMSQTFGRKCVHVCGLDGTERFKLQDSGTAWNPTHMRWSFRVLPADAEDDSTTLFTVNRDIIGRGPLGLREQWRVFRGRARDGVVVYYGVGSAWGWDYHFFRSQADHDAGKEPVAQLLQAPGTGAHSGESGVWLPAAFSLSAGPGEDAALLLAVATILDVAHERSQPPASVV